MTLVVEDGTGKTNSNTFATVQEADDYLTLRGITTWAALQNGEKESALVRATDFLANFDFKGIRAVAVQALQWPRDYIYIDGVLQDKTVIPQAIKNAQIELAWRGAAGPLNPDIKGTDSSQRMVTKEVKRVGPVDKETTYASRGQMAVPAKPVWSAVLTILAPYMRQSGGGVYR